MPKIFVETRTTRVKDGYSVVAMIYGVKEPLTADEAQRYRNIIHHEFMTRFPKKPDRVTTPPNP